MRKGCKLYPLPLHYRRAYYGFETCAVIGIVIALCIYVSYFYIAVIITELCCAIKIVVSDDNLDYKVPWLLFVLVLPVAGFMLYFLFYSRKLKPKFVRRLKKMSRQTYEKDDDDELAALKAEDVAAGNQASMLCKISNIYIRILGSNTSVAVRRCIKVCLTTCKPQISLFLWSISLLRKVFFGIRY